MAPRRISGAFTRNTASASDHEVSADRRCFDPRSRGTRHQPSSWSRRGWGPSFDPRSRGTRHQPVATRTRRRCFAVSIRVHAEHGISLPLPQGLVNTAVAGSEFHEPRVSPPPEGKFRGVRGKTADNPISCIRLRRMVSRPRDRTSRGRGRRGCRHCRSRQWRERGSAHRGARRAGAARPSPPSGSAPPRAAASSAATTPG